MKMTNLFPALAALGSTTMEDMFVHIDTFRYGSRGKKTNLERRKVRASYQLVGIYSNGTAIFRCKQNGAYRTKKWITREEWSTQERQNPSGLA